MKYRYTLNIFDYTTHQKIHCLIFHDGELKLAMKKAIDLNDAGFATLYDCDFNQFLEIIETPIIKYA